MDDPGIWIEDQTGVLQVFSDESCWRLKKDQNVNIRQVISSCRDILVSKNKG